ncbi:hypothetical protein GCM10009525_42360 [Streptosporangium amethystogenes subsp. fukuiense]
MKAREVAFGGLVGAEGQSAPLFDPVDAPFGRVALLVELCIMAERAAATGAAVLVVGRLVGLFGDDGLDVAPAQIEAVAAGGVGLVGGHRGRAGAWATDGQPDLDPGQDGAEPWAVAGLARGQDEGQRTASPVGRQVDLAGQPAPRAAQPGHRRPYSAPPS